MKERNYGIDFLRILSMFMVVVLHTLGNGGVLYSATPLSSHYWICWFLEISSYCAVNCFAIISGYVMLNAKTKISKITGLWFQVAFYTVIITVLAFIISPENISIIDVIKSFFPISTKHFWYISAYFGMYLLIPILNEALRQINKRTLEIVLFSSFAIFCITTTDSDPFVLKEGYSVLWLSLLYLLGGYFNKYKIDMKVKRRSSLILFVSMTLLTFISKVVIAYATTFVFSEAKGENILISYISPTVLLSAVGLFLLCAQFKFSNLSKRIISFIAPASLGVYIIHVCKPIFEVVMRGFSKNFINYNCILMLLLIIASSVIIYVACSIIDLLRIQLFKLIKIDKLCLAIERLIVKVYDKLYIKICAKK